MGDYLAATSGSNLLTSFILLGVFTSLLLKFVARRGGAKNARNSGLSRIPGPRQYLLGNYLNLLEYGAQKGRTTAMSNWCEGKGPIVRVQLGPFDLVFLHSPDYIQKLLGSAQGGHLGKPSIAYDDVKPVPWFDGILHSKGDKWKSRRKLITPILGYSSLLNYIPTLNRCAKELVLKLETQFQTLDPQPINELLFDTTMAALLETVFGIDVHGDDADDGELNSKVKMYIEKMKLDLQIVVTLIAQPWLRFEPIFRLHPISHHRRDFYQFSSEWILQLVKGILEGGGGGGGAATGTKSLLKDFLNAGLPSTGIYEESMTMIEAGYETAGGALHSLLFFLALHPAIQKECQEEVDSVFDNQAFCDVEEGNISASGLKQLQYLEQCVLECVRLRPPVPLYLRKLDEPLSLEDDLELPAGTTVGLWVPAVHMNPEYYPNPKMFDPGRFSPEMRSKRHPYAHVPFSAGARKCVGAKFAVMEMLAVTAHILRHFTITTTNKYEDVVWLHFVTLSPETPMKFVFEKRGG